MSDPESKQQPQNTETDSESEQQQQQQQQQIVEAIIETASMEAMWTDICAPSDGFSRWITEPPGDST